MYSGGTGLYSGGTGLYAGNMRGMGMCNSGCGCEDDECCRECIGGGLFDSIANLAKKGVGAVKKEASQVMKYAPIVEKEVMRAVKDPKTLKDIERFGIYQVIPTLSAGLGGLAAGTAAASTAAIDAGITAPMIPFASAAGGQAGGYAGNKLANWIGKETGIKKGKGMPKKGRFVKGSQEARDFMKSLRDRKGIKLN